MSILSALASVLNGSQDFVVSDQQDGSFVQAQDLGDGQIQIETSHPTPYAESLGMTMNEYGVYSITVSSNEAEHVMNNLIGNYSSDVRTGRFDD